MAKGVIRSLHNAEVDRCVDIVRRPDGSFGFKEFRRDAEDGGGWTLVSDHAHLSFVSEHEAVAAARAAVPWLRDLQQPGQVPSATKPSVAATLHNDDANRCVKIIKQSDGTFGFQEFRRDPEDAGGWTLVRDNLRGAYATQVQAAAAAEGDVAWLGEMTSARERL